MKRFKNFKALARALGVTSAAVVVVSGVTFAALQSQQDTLTANTIETATANLQLSIDGSYFSNSMPGYDFNNLIPGGPAMPVAGAPVYLKNTGNTALALKLAVSSVPSNPNNIDLSKINVLLTTVGGGGSPQSFSLQSLMDAANSGGLDITSGNIAAGNTGQYKLQIAIASDAVIGSSASLGNIDFAFNGVVRSN